MAVNLQGSFVAMPTPFNADDTIDFSGKTRIADRLCEFIEGTVDYYETQSHVFVHGWLPEKALTPGARQRAGREAWEKARWVKWTERYTGRHPLPDKTLVVGHMPTFYARAHEDWENNCDIFYGNGLIALDAGTAETKRINVLVIETGLEAAECGYLAQNDIDSSGNQC